MNLPEKKCGILRESLQIFPQKLPLPTAVMSALILVVLFSTPTFAEEDSSPPLPPPPKPTQLALLTTPTAEKLLPVALPATHVSSSEGDLMTFAVAVNGTELDTNLKSSVRTTKLVYRPAQTPPAIAAQNTNVEDKQAENLYLAGILLVVAILWRRLRWRLLRRSSG